MDFLGRGGFAIGDIVCYHTYQRCLGEVVNFQGDEPVVCWEDDPEYAQTENGNWLDLIRAADEPPTKEERLAIDRTCQI